MHARSTPSAVQQPTAVTDIRFPAMPQTLTEVMQLRSQGTQDINRLIEIVKKDTAIAASVLRRVNSAYHGLNRKIVQVEKAVHLLGYKDVYGLVLASVVKQAFAFRGSPEMAALYRHIMRGSAAAAMTAKLLAEQLSPMLTETSFTAGLLHQIGRLILLSHIPKAYAELWIRVSPTRDVKNLVSPSPAMEQFLFRTDYTQVGVLLAQQWRLPEEMLTVIQAHQDPGTVTVPFQKTLTLLVALGGAVAAELFEPVDREQEIAQLLESLRDVRGMNLDALTAVLAERREDVREFAESMVQD
jgi:HD-like signal output (HDOD) protein